MKGTIYYRLQETAIRNSKDETIARSGLQTKSEKSSKKYVKQGSGYEEESFQGQTVSKDLTLFASEGPTPRAIEQTKLVNLTSIIDSP